MFAAIRQWVIKTMMKGQTGVVQTMPKQQIIEMNTQITAERIMRNGINPEDLKTVGQVENVVNQIDTPKVNVNPGMTSVKKADVLDMEGNKIPDGAKIMGGKQIQPINMTVEERTGGLLKGKYESDKAVKEVPTSIDQENFLSRVNKAIQENRESDAAIKARLDTSNKKGIEGIKISLVDDSIAKIKSMEPMEAMKEANLVAGKKGRYANLDDNQVKKIMDDTQDHIFQDADPIEDLAIGGRVGLKFGAGEKFLKLLKKFKVKQSGDDVKEFLSKRQFMKDIVGNTEKNKKARQLRKIKEDVDNYMKQYKGYQFPSDEQIKIDLEKKIQPILNKGRKLNSDGGRIGLNKGGGLLKLLNFFNKKSPLQFGKDYLKNVKDKTLRANETGKFMDLPLAEVGIPATSGAFINNQIRKKLKNMNEEQKEENLKEFIMELENDEFYQKYPDLKDETIANYTEKLFGEKKADGGRIGLFMGSAYPKGAAALREMLKLFGKKSDSVKNPSDILRIVNPKQFNKTLEDPSIYRKFDVEKGIGAPDMIKNIQKKMTSDRQSTVKEMLDAAKNIKTADNNTIRYKNEMIKEMIDKGVDRKMAEEMAETISRMAEDATGKFNTPKLTDEGILQLENILKNMETGGKKPRDLNADGGRIGYADGTPSFEEYLKERGMIEKRENLERLKREFKEDMRRKNVMEQKQMAADGGRIGLKGGMNKRTFLKLMGSVGATIGAAKSGIFSGFGKGVTKQAAKEVAQQTTSGMPPPYFFKLAEKIKMMGDDATATTERTIAKTLKSKDGKSTYLLEEDITSGDTIIKKINKEGDEMITDVEIMELKKGEVVMGKNGKPVKVPDEYEEVTEANARIEGDTFNDPYYTDGIQVDEIIKEVDDKVPSIKYASGGLAYMLGE